MPFGAIRASKDLALARDCGWISRIEISSVSRCALQKGGWLGSLLTLKTKILWR